MQTILVTGATGFTGSYTVPLLLQQGITVRCLVRQSSDLSTLPVDKIELVYGDLDNYDSIVAAMAGVDCLVNIASIGFGHAPLILKAAETTGLKRAIFISTTALFTSLNASSKKVRIAAEEAIQQSDLAYTILRPTMIYGSSRDRNICRLIKYLQKWPLMPVFGDGSSLQQPIFVGDVASAIASVINTPCTLRKAYNISGDTAVSYNHLIETICALLKKHVRILHLPARPFIAGLTMLEKVSLPTPLKAEQIQRLNEDKSFSHEQAAADFGFAPKSLAAGLQIELEEMGIL